MRLTRFILPLLLLLSCATTSRAALFDYDTFTGTTGTALASHTPNVGG